jgi:hypothetical protein
MYRLSAQDQAEKKAFRPACPHDLPGVEIAAKADYSLRIASAQSGLTLA